MNAPQPLVTEVCTLPGAEVAAFKDMVGRLHDRADRLENGPTVEFMRDLPSLAADLRRAACLLDAAQAGLASFRPHPCTGLELVSANDLESLLCATLGTLSCMQFEKPGVPRWSAAIQSAIAAVESIQKGRP